MALQFLRVQNLMYFRSNHVHPTDNPESKLTISAAENSDSVESGETGSTARRCTICPVCILPTVVVFIFVFTIVQLIIIHHTIESYKLREQAYQDCYYPHGQNGHHSGPQPRHEEHVQQLELEHDRDPATQSAHGHRPASAVQDLSKESGSALDRSSGSMATQMQHERRNLTAAAGYDTKSGFV